MKTEIEQLLLKAGFQNLAYIYPAELAVLEAAMETARQVTHECGTPETTDAAILDTFREAIYLAARTIP